KAQGRHCGAWAAFRGAVVGVIGAAIISARAWPQPAKVVPLTAAGMALAAATLNLINELFGQEQAVHGSVDGGVHIQGGADPAGAGEPGIHAEAMRALAPLS